MIYYRLSGCNFDYGMVCESVFLLYRIDNGVSVFIIFSVGDGLVIFRSDSIFWYFVGLMLV